MPLKNDQNMLVFEDHIEPNYKVMKCRRCNYRGSHTIHGFDLHNRRYRCISCGKETSDHGHA